MGFTEDNTTYLDSEGFSNVTPAADAVDKMNSTATGGIQTAAAMLSLRVIYEVYVSLPIAVFGIVGNLVCIFVLRRYKPAMTTTMILQCLAWTNTTYLTASVVLRPLRYIGIPNYEHGLRYIFVWLFPTLHAVRLIDTWLIVLLTVDRFIAVCYPLHANRLCSRAKTSLIILIIVICSFAFSAPRYLENLAIMPDNNQTGTPLSPQDLSLIRNRTYTFIYRLSLFSVAMYLIPMTTVTILNTRLLVTLRRSASYRATSLCVNSFTSSHSTTSSDRSFTTKASCSSSISSTSTSSCASMTRMVTAVSVTVILISIATDTVAMLAHGVWSLEQIFPHLRTQSIYSKYLVHASNVAITLRCALNFVVYCAVSRQFRAVLFRSVVCRRGRRQTTTGGGGIRQGVALSVSHQSSNKISTVILSFITGQRQKSECTDPSAATAAGENVACVEHNPFNHALISFVKR